jgi:hypothetical protein
MVKWMLSIEDKTELIIAIRNYRCIKTKKMANCTDFTVLDTLNKKVLMRCIEPQGNGYIGICEVKSMIELIKREDYNQGILISNRFTAAALDGMVVGKIQKVSDEYMPPVETERLYLTIFNCISNQCKAKCGKIALKDSDCQEKLQKGPCKIKSIANNALFHFEQGWIDLLQNDLKLALALNK